MKYFKKTSHVTQNFFTCNQLSAMAEEKEQAKPLTTEAARSDDIEENIEPSSAEFLTRHNRKLLICCGCCSAIFLILVMIVLILSFTVFRFKDPVLKMNSMKIDGVNELISNENSRRRGLNLTVEADFSVENPNFASFKFSNTTTSVYYDASVIGEVEKPSGQVGARKTVRMNATVGILVDSIFEAPRFKSDLAARILPISTYTRVRGKVKVGDVFKRSFLVKMNCTMNVNISSQAIQDQNCHKRVSI